MKLYSDHIRQNTLFHQTRARRGEPDGTVEQPKAKRAKAIPEFPALMRRGKLNWKWRVDPEQRDCIEFADALRMASLDGRLKAVWTHIPNEGKRSKITAQIMKAMGMLTGAPDYVFLGENGGALLEFKHGKNNITEWQFAYLLWAKRLGVPCAVVRSADEGLERLKEWGLLV